MADPCVRTVGVVEDMDGRNLGVGVDYDTILIGPDGYRLTRAQAGEFARLFVAACWEAAASGERMRQEADVGP